MSEDTRREITLHSTRLNRDFPVCVYRSESGDYVVMHRSLREVFDSIEQDSRPIEKEPVQLPVPANDTSTLWVFRQDLVFSNGSVIWGIGSISKNEMAKRPNLIRDMFRPDIAINRAFDNAVLRWLRFELKAGDRIVRWFYGSESMDMHGAIPVTERNLTDVMASAKNAPFNDPGGQARSAPVPGYRPVNQAVPVPAPVPGAVQQAQGLRPPAGNPAQGLANGVMQTQGFVPAGNVPQAAASGNTNRMQGYSAPVPDVQRVYFDLNRMQTRVDTSLGTMWYSPDTHQWTGDTLNPASVDIGRVMTEASRLFGRDISDYRGET